jgi:Icc-related predicted phosphoesterase
MKALFVTDLGGVEWKYERLLPLAREARVGVVVNSGCMLPAGNDPYAAQRTFVSAYLPNHFAGFEAAGIHYFFCPGVSDLAAFDAALNDHCRQLAHVRPIAQQKTEVRGFEFVGSHWTADSPAVCKDRCRRDGASGIMPGPPPSPIRSSATGWEEIPDWPQTAQSLPSLKDELENLPQPANKAKCTYIIQSPPADAGMCELWNGCRVGSKSVRDFLKTNQPLLSVHGFGSADGEADWRTKIGRTFCVQSGQDRDLLYIVIDLAILNVIRYRRSA